SGSAHFIPPRIVAFRVSVATDTSDDSALLSQFPERPVEISDRESPTLPICHRVPRAETIEIDRNINISPTETSNEHFEMVAPIVPQDRAATLSMFHRAIVGPRMNFEPPFAFTSA